MWPFLQSTTMRKTLLSSPYRSKVIDLLSTGDLPFEHPTREYLIFKVLSLKESKFLDSFKTFKLCMPKTAKEF